MTTVSVVMATYNGARFLPEQLDSLVRQTVLPFELVVGDDGSTDGTVDLLERFRRVAPFPVTIIQNQPRLGYGQNYLNAASSARGSFIAFCDQDDVWREDKLAAALQALSARPGALFVHAARVIDEAGQPLGVFSQGIESVDVRPPLTHRPWSVYYGFSMVFERSLLTWIDPSERGRHTFEHDGLLSHDLWVYFLGTGLTEAILDPRPLVDYRRHGANATPDVNRRTFRAWTSSLGVAASRELRRDAIAAHRTALLDRLSRSADDEGLRRRAAAASEHWARITAHEAARLQLYTERSSVRRAYRYLLLLASGAYGPAASAGQGSRLALKDLLAGVLALRRTDGKPERTVVGARP